MPDLIFEWDAVKAQVNLSKHGIAFEEAKTVFNDPLVMTTPDTNHSEIEERWYSMGFSTTGKLLIVWYTEREDIIRIIGCRQATNAERGAYESE